MRQTQADILEVHQISKEILDYSERLSAAQCWEGAAAATTIASALTHYAGSPERSNREPFKISATGIWSGDKLVSLKK